MPTLAQIARVIHGDVDGDDSIEITHACDIKAGHAGGITFLATPAYSTYLADSGASAVILGTSMDSQGLAGIRVENPALGFAAALAYLHPEAEAEPGVHPSAQVERDVKLGQDVSIGPCATLGAGATVGDGAVIGAGTYVGRGASLGHGVHLYPSVVLYDSVILGDEVIVHSGTVIGADGFGYVSDNDVHHKVPQVGGVVIGRQVEIGANSTIDRGTIGDTTIGAGTKIDNLVHIAHNVKVGRGCLLAGEVGIAGSTEIGDFVILAGQVGVVDHVTIGDRAVVASKSAVMQSLEGGKTYAGIPALEQPRWLRQSASIKKLPELAQRLRRFEARLDELEAADGQARS